MSSPDNKVIRQLIPRQVPKDTAVYLHISNSLLQAIRRGQLHRGYRLPGSREMAGLLGVHRKTVVAAYDELLSQGWIEVLPRKGTFVTNNLPDVKPIPLDKSNKWVHYPERSLFAIEESIRTFSPHENFPSTETLIINDGFPDLRLVPTDIIFRELRSVATKPVYKKHLQYGNPKGTELLCQTLTEFLNETRGLPVNAENVMITQGAQMALYLSVKLLLKPGDEVIVGEPGYFTANYTFEQFGAVVNKVPVDDFGINVDAVEALCQRKRIRVLFVIPHHHHPTTVTLSPERRIRLLQLAANYKFAIIEDDYDFDFHYDRNPVLPLASLDQNGSVIYLGTLSKTLAPGIRIGFLVGPRNFIQQATGLRRIIDRQGDTILEVAIARLYQNGMVQRHIKKSVKLYHERRDHFCELLQTKLGNKISFKVPRGGMSIWTTFNSRALYQIAKDASKKKLFISNGAFYNSGTKNYNSCRLGFASLNFKEQEKAISILREIL